MEEKKGRVKMIREKIDSYVNSMTTWKACVATIVFAVLLWVIDFSPITLMLVNYPKRLETVCRITSSVSAVKMVCVKTAVVVLLMLFVWFVLWKICGLVKLKK